MHGSAGKSLTDIVESVKINRSYSLVSDAVCPECLRNLCLDAPPSTGAVPCENCSRILPRTTTLRDIASNPILLSLYLSRYTKDTEGGDD